MKVTPPEGMRLGNLSASLGGTPGTAPGSEAPPDCCEVGETPPDRADEDAANAWQLNTPSAPGLVQWAEAVAGTSLGTQVVMPAAVTPGHLLIAVGWYRNAEGSLPDGFDEDEVHGSDPYIRLGHRVAQSGDGDTFDVDAVTTVQQHVVIMEWSGIDAPDNILDGTLASTTATNIDPGTGVPIGVYAVGTDIAGREVHVIAPSTLVYEEWADDVGDFGPWASIGYADAGDGLDIQATAGAISFHQQHYIVGNYPENASTPVWVIPAYLAIDGDDATYITVDGETDLVRVDLGAAFPIAQTRIRIDTETTGARTLTIKAANLPDFSDEVTVTTIAFTATGSAQDVSAVWIPDDSYRYWELSIDVAEENRVHTWELREATPGSNVVTDPTNGDAPAVLQDVLDNLDGALDDHLADTTDAHDASAISIVDAGGYYTGTTVEAALQEAGPSLTGRWEVVVDGTAPPVAVTTEAEDDWLYALVT